MHKEFALPSVEIQQYHLEPDRAMIGISWFIAAAYCNWLSQIEGLPENEWCYVWNAKKEYATGMRIKANALELRGYRLPTEAEWEYACRAGSTTSRDYGNSPDLLGRYAWYLKNSGEPYRVQSCGRKLPNDLGLFDMLGNVTEWCQDRHSDVPESETSSIYEIIADSPRLLRGGTFSDQALGCPPACRRVKVAPENRDLGFGFRPARTYMTSP